MNDLEEVINNVVRERRAQNRLTLFAIIILIVIVAGIAYSIFAGAAQEAAINELRKSLDAQRSQFIECVELTTPQPASGCSDPVSEPSGTILENSTAIPSLDGPQVVRITSISCVSGIWIVIYSDGVSTQAGKCSRTSR